MTALDGDTGQVPQAREEQLVAEATTNRSSVQPVDTALKREEAENIEDAALPEPDQLVVREVVTRAGRTSKTATPLTSTFPEFPAARNRNARNKDSGNGSHASSESGDRASIKEKRTGRRNGGTPSLLAERRKAAIEADAKDEDDIVPDEDQSELDEVVAAEGEDDDVDVEDVDDNEPRYCYCNNVSYGEMVACDNENCPREWFHLKCAGLKEAPGENSKWNRLFLAVRALSNKAFSEMVLQVLQGGNGEGSEVMMTLERTSFANNTVDLSQKWRCRFRTQPHLR